MSKLEDLVPPLELCRKIPPGEFKDTALIWFFDGYSWWVNATEFDAQPEKAYPAPTWQEIMEGLNEDMSSIEYRDSSPHWVVHSPLTDKTPAGDNAAEALLRYWLDRKGWNK